MNTTRRDLLKFGALATAAAALPSIASSGTTPAPVGKAAMKKMPVYMADLMPSIQKEVLKAQAKAQSEAQNDVFGGEIVVTAQRQSERLQDVPIAVTASSSDRRIRCVSPGASPNVQWGMFFCRA